MTSTRNETTEPTDLADLVALADVEPKRRSRRGDGRKPKPTADVSAYPPAVRPSALFLPESIEKRLADRALVRRLSLAGVGVIAVLGVAFGGLTYLTSDAESTLSDIDAQNAAVNNSIDALAPVGDFYDTYTDQRAQAADSIAADVSYSRVLDSISSNVPDGVTVTGYTVEYGNRNPGPSPFETPDAIGGVSISGTAGDLSEVTAFVSNLTNASVAPDALLVQPYLSSTLASANGESTTFEITVNFTAAAYSGKGATVLGGDLPTPPTTFDSADGEN